MEKGVERRVRTDTMNSLEVEGVTRFMMDIRLLNGLLSRFESRDDSNSRERRDYTVCSDRC